ncbi:hypothetical protein BDW74DRAFT_158495 [Aspergillus multicolor]|uniref:uncharacterized protein n=1 Tax=Aspergillus multicolor TaxID=41759 RepID=UPI003CCD8183
MNTSATRQQPLLSPCRALNADKYKYSHISKNGQNSNKDTSTGTDQSEDGVTLTPSRRVNPTTGLMGYVLRPKSRPDYSAMLRPENEEAIYTDSSDGEEDAFTDRPLLASSPIDGDHEGHAEEHGKADAEPEENAKSGQGSAQNWSLFELAARGLEMLHQHDTHGAENGGEANTN